MSKERYNCIRFILWIITHGWSSGCLRGYSHLLSFSLFLSLPLSLLSLCLMVVSTLITRAVVVLLCHLPRSTLSLSHSLSPSSSSSSSSSALSLSLIVLSFTERAFLFVPTLSFRLIRRNICTSQVTFLFYSLSPFHWPRQLIIRALTQLNLALTWSWVKRGRQLTHGKRGRKN